jgi:hypothetical protein
MNGPVQVFTVIALISLPTVTFGGFSLLPLVVALSRTGQWIVGALLVAGVLAQSGGMFVHMGIGKPGQWSAGDTLSSVGAVLLAGALLTTGAAVIAS